MAGGDGGAGVPERGLVQRPFQMDGERHVVRGAPAHARPLGEPHPVLGEGGPVPGYR
nr:hypothetical protein GCM10020093_010040 [Planobispora longispora]